VSKCSIWTFANREKEGLFMRIEKKTIWQMDFPYAVITYNAGGETRLACATETTGSGHCFSAQGEHLETLWEEPGGTMTICHMGGDRFLATHRFFKRFQSQDAVVSAVTKQPDGSWRRTEVLKLPYLHRFCVLDGAGEKWLVGGTLCDRKDSFEDWSHAGGIYVGKIPEDIEQPMKAKLIYHGIHKNHGLYCGRHKGRDVAILTGVEGAFEVLPPEKAEGDWQVNQLLDVEISDIRVFDLDGDGREELITIEGFHGDRLKVYRDTPEGYKKIYEYPIAFGHGLWCGKIFGRPSILIGYKNANGALVLLQPKPGETMSMEATVIDELEQVANLAVYDAGEEFHIYAACSVGNLNMYTLKKEES